METLAVADVFVPALAGHLIGDWFLQTSQMARYKAVDWLWSAMHATTVSLAVLTFVLWANLSADFDWRIAALTLVNLLTHAVIDRRAVIRAWMRSVQSWTGPDGEPPFWGILALDQALHVSIIAVTVAVLW